MKLEFCSLDLTGNIGQIPSQNQLVFPGDSVDDGDRSRRMVASLEQLGNHSIDHWNAKEDGNAGAMCGKFP